MVSGGVDSSVALVRLKEMGFDPTIFYIKIAMEDEEGLIDCPSEEDIEITSYIAKKYGCKRSIGRALSAIRLMQSAEGLLPIPI